MYICRAVSHSSDNEEGGWWVVVVKMGRVSLPLFIQHSAWLTDVRPSARFMSKFILKKKTKSYQIFVKIKTKT